MNWRARSAVRSYVPTFAGVGPSGEIQTRPVLLEGGRLAAISEVTLVARLSTCRWMSSRVALYSRALSAARLARLASAWARRALILVCIAVSRAVLRLES